MCVYLCLRRSLLVELRLAANSLCSFGCFPVYDPSVSVSWVPGLQCVPPGPVVLVLNIITWESRLECSCKKLNVLCKFSAVFIWKKQKPLAAWFELSASELGPSFWKVLSIFTNSTAIAKTIHSNYTVLFSLNILPSLFGLILAKALNVLLCTSPDPLIEVLGRNLGVWLVGYTSLIPKRFCQQPQFNTFFLWTSQEAAHCKFNDRSNSFKSVVITPSLV